MRDNFINIEYKDEKFIKKIINEFCEINNYIYKKNLDSLNTFEIDNLILAYKKKYRLNYTKIGQLILNYYYTNKNILKIIGYKNSPPFPKGNYLIEGDLYLFEHVIEKDKMYRD